MAKPDYEYMAQRRHQRQVQSAQRGDRSLSGSPQARPFSQKERVSRGGLAAAPIPPKSPIHDMRRLQAEKGHVGPAGDRETVKRVSQRRGPIRPLSRPRSR
jgi:hypothetical protein